MPEWGMRHDRQGFTAIELMMVVMIIGLIAVLVVPGFISSREQTRARLCMTSQRVIDGAVDHWAMAYGVPEDTTAPPDNLLPYIKFHAWPVCPCGSIRFDDPVVGVPVNCPLLLPNHKR